MSNLNEWQLQYPGTNFTFGTLASTFPMAAQVEVGDVDIDVQDQKHPSSDGLIMGYDSYGGFDLLFTLTTIPSYPPPAEPWDAALDLISTFKSKWRADSIRRVPGAYATLLNTDRNRLVYGRPRTFKPNIARVRKGVAGYTALFQTNDPNFYSGTEKVATITPVPASSGGIKSPVKTPVITVGSTQEVSAAVNAGDLPAWPTVQFRGPAQTSSLELLSGSTVLWSLSIPDAIQYDEVLTVDTRPWSRSATINGRPANGRVRGTQLEKCLIPVGTYQWRYRVTDRTGTAYAVMKWRDAYASL